MNTDGQEGQGSGLPTAHPFGVKRADNSSLHLLIRNPPSFEISCSGSAEPAKTALLAAQVDRAHDVVKHTVDDMHDVMS